MIWLFERTNEALWVETQYDNVAREYVLAMRHPGGEVTVERYPNTQTLETRLAGLEERLSGDSWEQRSTRLRMKDSWQLA